MQDVRQPLQPSQGWPLYLVCTSVFPPSVEELFLVTTSLPFARCVCQHLQRCNVRAAATLFRVSQYNRWLQIDESALKTVKALDQLRPHTSLSVVHRLRCKLCIRFASQGCMSADPAIIVGVNSCHQGPCQAHQTTWYPQYSHEVLALNALSTLRSQSTRSSDMAALRSAKAEWLGRLYFARSFRHLLPAEVMERVLDLVQ